MNRKTAKALGLTILPSLRPLPRRGAEESTSTGPRIGAITTGGSF